MSGDITSQLNPQQAEAVQHIHGPLLVLAGAGTGKTRVITFRIAEMLRRGIPAEHILGVTFTNKAAREMKERLSALVPPEVARDASLGTFHSICCRVLRSEISELGFTSSFTICDETDQAGLIRQAMGEKNVSKDEVTLETIKYRIGSWKNKMIFPEDLSGEAPGTIDFKIISVYERYQQLLKNQNVIDFDDILLYSVKIFRDFPAVLEKFQEKYKYLLVDEYQDTNTVQLELLKLLSGREANICVVGDDDQSIYGWRGAVAENILKFPEMFTNAKVVKLERNYRSTNKILKAANHIIAANTARYNKSLWSEQGEGENIKILRLNSPTEEADFIAEAVEDIINNDKSLSFSDFAVLFRSNHLSRNIEQSFNAKKIPFKLVGGQEFFKRKEVKDAAAYLKIIVNPKDNQSLLRILGVPPRGIGDKAIRELKKLHSASLVPMSELLGNRTFLEKLPPSGAKGAESLFQTIFEYKKIFSEAGHLALNIKNYLNGIGYYSGLQKVYRNLEDSKKRQANVDEFINAAAEFENKSPVKPSLSEFLESFSLLDENDRAEEEDKNPNSVVLTTVHAAKGLEFPYVFLMGMEDKTFPHERSTREGALEEERRLFYVAVTRAKTNLVITFSLNRMAKGKMARKVPSRFLKHIPEEYADKIGKNEFFKPMDRAELLNAMDKIFEMLK